MKSKTHNFRSKMEQISDLSTFVENSRKMLAGALSELGWTPASAHQKDKSALVHCPFDRSHLVPEGSLQKHTIRCQLSKEQLQPQDFIPSSQFFYKSSPAVVSVFLDANKYESFKSAPESEQSLITQQDHQKFEEPLQYGDDIDPNEVVVEEQSADFEDESDTSLESSAVMEHKEGTSPDEVIRSIYTWKVVPLPYHHLKLDILSAGDIKRWLVENLPNIQLLSSVAGADVQLVNFVWSCLNEDTVAHPDGMVAQLKELLASKTRPFVLKLWKFLAVSIVATKHGVSQAECERLRAEAGLTKTDRDSQRSPALGAAKVLEGLERKETSPAMSKPMNRVRTELTPQQRIAVYEYVLQVSKATKKRSTINLSELEKELETAEGKSEETDGGAKSHVEVLAEMRDYKRRRQSYRAKNVHITKRSAVDVMRDLIETQMKTLQPEGVGEEESGTAGGKEKRGRERSSSQLRRHSDDDHEAHARDEKHRHSDERTPRKRHSHHSDRHRHRHRSRDRAGDRYRHRSRSRDRHKDKNRSADRDRSRSKDVDDNRDTSPSRRRHKKKSRDREREKEKSPERDEGQESELSKDGGQPARAASRSRERSRESGERSTSDSDSDRETERRKKHKHRHHKKEKKAKEDRGSQDIS